ncbi:MAG: sodium:proton antiporter, partial [Muribaculaceae bacterium]|nr:sodium:proton antiporter [Muribaculaceae bacterium]
PWTLVIPVVTLAMIAFRINTLIVLATSALMGAVGVFVFQPGWDGGIAAVAQATWHGFTNTTGVASVDELTSTGGITGMMPVVYLVLSALCFGWMLISTGMLQRLTDAFTRRLRRRTSIVASTLGSGIVLNACTADQYLSLIISGNMFRNVYRRAGMEDRMLSRTIEDGVSVTSPLIPWSSCGVTQATVLGVPTLTYLPYCLFNYLTPIMSMVVIALGFKVKSTFASVVIKTKPA